MLTAYSIFDKKAATYNTPFFCINDGVACRSFSDLVRDHRSTVGQHPEDFALYRLGEFNDLEGIISPCAPTAVAEAVAFVPPVDS